MLNSNFWEKYKYHCLLVILWILAYYNNLFNAFFYDDYNQIVMNNKLNDIFSFGDVLFCGVRQVRVIQNITFAIDKTLAYAFQQESLFFHISSNLLHLYSVFLVHRISKMFLKNKDEIFHFFVAALFLIAPIQIQTVTYIMGRIGILQNISIFLLLLELGKKEERKNWKIYALLIFSYLVKENNAILPFFIIAFDFYLYPQSLRKDQILKFYIPCFMTLGVLALANYILIDPGGWTHSSVVGFSLYWNKLEYFLTQGFYFFFTLYLILNPSENLVYHEHWTFNWTIGTLGLIFWIGSISLFLYLTFKKKDRSFYTFLLFYFLMFYGSTNSFLQMVNPFAEYRISLYLLPLIFWFVAGLDSLREKVKVNLNVINVLFVLYFTLFTHLNNKMWKNEHQAWIIAHQRYPQSTMISIEMARFYVRHFQFKKALEQVDEALKVPIATPFHRWTLMVLKTKLYFYQGKLEETIKMSKEVIKQYDNFDFEFFRMFLASLYFKQDIKEYNRIIDLAENIYGKEFRVQVKELIHQVGPKRFSEEYPIHSILKESKINR